MNVTLQGVATKTSRHIVWDIPETNHVYTVDVVELGAQALTDVLMNRTVHRIFLPNGVWYDFKTGKN